MTGPGPARIQRLDALHVPHGWDVGLIWEETTRTLLCGDLLTQPGANLPPLTEGGILSPAEPAMKQLFFISLP